MATKKKATFAGLQRSTPDFNPDYSDVVKDLRRIGILAGIFLLVLIGLTFILR